MNVKKNQIKLVALFALSMLAFSFVNSSEKEAGDFTDAESHIISVSKAKNMKDKYAGTIAPLISNLRSTPEAIYDPTQFAYIELSTLKSYVAILDHINASNTEKVSGVRIYFSAYSKSDKYPDRETLFMAPTVKVAESELSRTYRLLENLPFTIKPTGNDKYVGRFEITNELLNQYDNRPPFTSTPAATNTSLILNDLQLVPPPK